MSDVRDVDRPRLCVLATYQFVFNFLPRHFHAMPRQSVKRSWFKTDKCRVNRQLHHLTGERFDVLVHVNTRANRNEAAAMQFKFQKFCQEWRNRVPLEIDAQQGSAFPISLFYGCAGKLN